jgi:hypothetical protein
MHVRRPADSRSISWFQSRRCGDVGVRAGFVF